MIISLQAGKLTKRSRSLNRVRIMPKLNQKLLQINQIAVAPFQRKHKRTPLFDNNKNKIINWKPLKNKQLNELDFVPSDSILNHKRSKSI